MIPMICLWRQKISAVADAGARAAAVQWQNRLWRACQAIRHGDLDRAEELLQSRPRPKTNATYWNLLGLLAEARGDWNQARRYWRRALRMNPHHWAAERNLRRYFEFYEWGWSEYVAAFGDEIEYGILFLKETLP